MLHGGWVGAGEAVGCNVAVGAVVTGAQALRKAKNGLVSPAVRV